MGHTLLQHCFLAIVMAALTVSAQAASRPKTTSTPDTVKDVLQSESLITSLSVDRRETLHPGTRPQNDSVSIWWQSGYVRSGKHWLPYEELAVGDPSEAKLDEYRSLRAELLEDPHGSWKLATWCRKNSLFDQERVHLLQVLEIKDSSVSLDAVYERLGCQKVGDEWVSPQSRREAALLQVEMEASYKKWHSKLDLIAEQLEGISLQRGIAEKQLTAIRSPSAVPAIVSILCMRTSNTAGYGVKTLAQIPGYQASRALAGQAVFSPWRFVRRKATEELKDRNFEDFVPDLLLLLATPIRTTILTPQRELGPTPTFHPSNATDGLSWDYVWADETQDKIQVGFRRLFPFWLPPGSYQVVSVRYPWIAGYYDESGRRLNIDLNSILAAMHEEKFLLDQTAEMINEDRSEMNRRVGKILSESTDQPMSDDPKDWWNWWMKHSNVSSPYQKPVVIVQKREPVQLIPTVRTSCLVAGTPIWTERGFVAIEQIRPGDRVLSKDISNGELGYKPVLRTTERAPTAVFKFTVAGEDITASLGHHFWVSGIGWKKTRELGPQAPLHTVTGMQRITAVEDEGQIAKVYNLDVADFHTYFIGKTMVLSHDVMTPALTNVKVPGLPAVD